MDAREQSHHGAFGDGQPCPRGWLADETWTGQCWISALQAMYRLTILLMRERNHAHYYSRSRLPRYLMSVTAVLDDSWETLTDKGSISESLTVSWPCNLFFVVKYDFALSHPISHTI